MPTYQYACTECRHAFDQVQSFTDDSLTECPVCEGRLRKVFNAVGVVFKGSGFYRTDSRSGSPASDSSASSSSSSSSDSKESKSTTSSDSSSSGSSSSSTTAAPSKASTSGQSSSTGDSAS